MKVLVLGAGKMTQAILLGLRKSENLSEWMIYSPSGTSAAKLAALVGAKAVSDLNSVSNPDWILLGCKPQQLSELKVTLNGLFKETLFVSMLAALPEDDQRQVLEVKELIRIMPNLPVEHNQGVTLMTSKSAQARLPSFESLFSKLGTALVVNETELEELTLLTGSGPAFFYEFARELGQSFESLDEGRREKLVRQVLQGAAISIDQNPKNLLAMTQDVTSKGGVTIAVLNHWRESKFGDFIKRGVKAGKERGHSIRSLLN
jgi:pyrroline-5-carboxylate reductase